MSKLQEYYNFDLENTDNPKKKDYSKKEDPPKNEDCPKMKMPPKVKNTQEQTKKTIITTKT